LCGRLGVRYKKKLPPKRTFNEPSTGLPIGLDGGSDIWQVDAADLQSAAIEYKDLPTLRMFGRWLQRICNPLQ